VFPSDVNLVPRQFLGDSVHFVQFQVSRVLNCMQGSCDQPGQLWDIKWNRPFFSELVVELHFAVTTTSCCSSSIPSHALLCAYTSLQEKNKQPVMSVFTFEEH